MGAVVVGVDGSEGAAHALRWAAAEATFRGWTTRAVMAWGFLDQHHAIVAERFDPKYSSDEARQALDAYVEAALGPERAAGVERLLVTDLSARALIEASAKADLLVVGARGLGGFRGLLLGSVSQKCLHHATVPIAVIRPSQDVAARQLAPRVVVGVDGSAASRGALIWAIEEARARAAVLEVVHAWQPPFVGGLPFTVLTVDESMFEDAATQLMSTVLDGIDMSGLTRPVERTVVRAGASAALLEAAGRADVVVVGARGADSVERLLLGSVSNQVALHATRPVVVVPAPPHQ